MTRDAEHTPSPQSVVVPVEPTPLTEPVSMLKAFSAHTLARAVDDAGGSGRSAVHLVNIGMTGWTHTPETARSYAEGYNLCVDLFKRWLATAPAPSSLAGGEVDETIRTAWGGAMTVACNIAIDEQNRTNDDDGPSDVLNAQGEIIRRLKAVLEIDAPYLAEVKAALSPEAPAREWSEFEDDISDALADSLDMDWTSRDGARAVVAWLAKNAPHQAAASVLEAKVFKQAFWRLAFDDAPAFDNPGDCKWRLSASATRILAEAAIAAISPRHEAPASAVDDLVDRFAVALKEKLRAAEAKYGHDDAWLRDDWRDDLIRQLGEHVRKGDPRDVAAYCAFAWHHDWSIGHEAPAEGAGETENPGGYLIKDFADGWFWTPHRIAAVAALTDGHAVYDLRARSSAPESREGEAVACSDFNPDLSMKGEGYCLNCDRHQSDHTHPAAPSADKLRKEVTRDQIMGVVRQYAAPAWCSVDRMADALVAIMSPASTPDALKGEAK